MAAPTMQKSLSFSPSPPPTHVERLSFTMTKQERRDSAKMFAKLSQSSSELNKKKKMNKKRRKKAQTNTFLSAVNVGQTVRLTQHRIGFIRYKGKVKFGVGTWYGLEIYDSITKTRHNGTVYGKRYFNCPRNKGLFIKREIIIEIIKSQNIKKVLCELEKKQIAKKKKQKKKEKQKQIKQQQQQIAVSPINKARENNSILALYQSQVYGNNALKLKLQNDPNIIDDEKKIQKDFRRFNRLSFMATNNPEIKSMIKKDNDIDIASNIDEDEKKDFEEEKDIDIDCEAWDSLKERQILELLDEDGNNDQDGDIFNIRLFYSLNEYIPIYQYVFNRGLLIKEIDTIGKKGRALILECGIQGNNGWYIQSINDENIKKYSKDAIDQLLNKLVVNIGYEILLKKE